MAFYIFGPVQRTVEGGPALSLLRKRPLRLPSPEVLLVEVAAAERRAKQRTLGDEPALVDRWLAAIRRAYRVASRCPADRLVAINARAHGGAVPNSYGYSAEATTLVLTADGAVEARRDKAPSRSGGGGPHGFVKLEATGAPPAIRACLGISPGASSRAFVV